VPFGVAQPDFDRDDADRSAEDDSRLSVRIATARKSLSLLIVRSTLLRSLYASASNAGGRPPVEPMRARSIALAGFCLHSLHEIGASTVVLWELAYTGARQRRAPC
jgi:hypothetical protein